MSIRVLAPDVVDKIAAGEVLERPANLVKELIENSLDAGADSIEVEFDNGGREVSVYDNGSGIEGDELALALKRHATSKISSSDDIYRLHSFGFRGEALASVAAVSKLTLTSRRRGSAQAYRVVSDFGAIGGTGASVNPAVEVSAREGTEIRVSQLFENVPARLRFMKSEASEHGQIKTTLKALALANEGVAFRARSRGELVFHWPKGQDLRERAQQILQVKKLYPGSLEMGGMSAEVLVSSPQDTMNVNRNMWFFVQGRWIQDRSLSAAVMEAYRNTLMHGEYPSVMVRLTLPPEEVDVNVHPTKAQVKFRDAQSVFRLVCRAIREVLEKAPWLEVQMPSVGSGAYAGIQPSISASAPSSPLTGTGQASAGMDMHSPDTSSLKFEAPEFDRTQYSTKAFPLAQVREVVRTYVAPKDTAAVFKWADLQVIGQMNHTYIVAQSADAFYLVDQHAAHERVVFERLMDSFRKGHIDVQNLLLPMVFDLSAEEVEALVAHQFTIAKMGLSIERMGPESVAVQSIPSMVSESSVSEALQKLAFEIMDHGDSLAWEKVVADIFASMACHSVIRAGQSQSVEQMKSLLQQMDDFPLSSFCPHGRPVFVKRTFPEVEREFGRIV